ncbi:MAG: cation:proton antiporter [Firmicutes bacterium]|nr:cation:proton antiporter [Bacillota bacterium]
MDVLLKLAIIVLVGCLAGRLARTFGLSNVFGFVIAGIILGPSCLKFLSSQDLTSLTFVVELAVAILAFKIGSEFVVRDIKKLGKSFMVIAFAEAACAVLFAFVVMRFLFRQDLVFSLVMASMAAATAPAAMIMVIRQYRADGPVTRMLLPVTALNGVIGVVLFGVAISVSRVFVLQTDLSMWQTVTVPLIQIVGGLLLGALLGLALSFLGQKAGDSDELLVITIGMILTATAAAKALSFSPLLANIMMGVVLVNFTQNSNRVFFSLNNFTPPIYLLFFTLTGASLNLGIVANVGFLTAAYILSRAAGKILGAWAGSKVIKAETAVQKHLGLALLPQGGLSIALAVLVNLHLADIGNSVIAIMIVSVLLYEIGGPVLAKTAIARAGEIRGMTSAIR